MVIDTKTAPGLDAPAPAFEIHLYQGAPTGKYKTGKIQETSKILQVSTKICTLLLFLLDS